MAKSVGNLPASDVGWLSWSADGRTLAVGTSTSTTPMEVRFVDATRGTEVADPLTLPGPSLFALDATGERLAAGSLGSGQSQLFDVATHEPVGEPLDVNVGLLAFSDDSTLVATTSNLGVTRILDTRTGRQIGPDLMSAPGQRAGIAFDPDGDAVFVAGQDGDIIVHGVGGRTKIAQPIGIPGWLAYPSSDTDLVAIPSIPTNDEIRIVEVETGTVVHTLRPAQPFVNYTLKGVLPAAISPDRTRVAVGSEATNGELAAIEVFTLSTGRSRRLVVEDVPYIGMPLRWSPDGDRIAAATPDGVLVVDATTGQELEDLAIDEIDGAGALAFDARGRLVITDLAGKTIVFDESGEPLARYGDPDEPQNGTWASDGSLVLTNPFTGVISVVDPETGEPVAPSFPAGSPLVAFVGANGIGVAVTWNNIVTLWDVATGRQIGQPFNPSDATVISSVVDASGTHLVSGGSDTVVWELDPAMWRVRACEAAGRNLTQEEWEEFLPEGEAYHAYLSAVHAGGVTMPDAVVVREPGRTPIHLVVHEPIEIGRDCAGVLLADPEISRRHLELRPNGSGIVVTDLGSLNGTLLNGRPLEIAMVLHGGDLVQFGGCSVEVTGQGTGGILSSPRASSIELVAAAASEQHDSYASLQADAGTVTIVFSDIESSTERAVELGDAKWVELLGVHNSIVRRAVDRHHGREIKAQGDGFMLAFPSTRSAVQCMTEVQRGLQSHARSRPTEAIRIRVGLHTGEVIQDDDGDLFGKHVVLAARIANEAHGGEVLVSSLVREIVDARGDLRFGDPRTVVELKGIAGTHTVHPVRWDEAVT